MTTGMRQHRAMVLISNIHRRQFRAILVGFKELLLSEIERGRAAKQGEGQ